MIEQHEPHTKNGDNSVPASLVQSFDCCENSVIQDSNNDIYLFMLFICSFCINIMYRLFVNKDKDSDNCE